MLTKILLITAVTVLAVILYAALVNMTPEEKRQEDLEQLEWLESLRKHKEENRKEMGQNADH